MTKGRRSGRRGGAGRGARGRLRAAAQLHMEGGSAGERCSLCHDAGATLLGKRAWADARASPTRASSDSLAQASGGVAAGRRRRRLVPGRSVRFGWSAVVAALSVAVGLCPVGGDVTVEVGEQEA